MATRKQRQRKAAKAKAQALVGRRIVKAEPRFFDDGGYYGVPGYAHSWCLTLDDGTRVYLSVEETETGEYGCDLTLYKDKVAAEPAEPAEPRYCKRCKCTERDIELGAPCVGDLSSYHVMNRPAEE